MDRQSFFSTEIKAEPDSILLESFSSFFMAKNSIAKFKHGRTTTNDEPHSGRPKMATPPYMLEMFQNKLEQLRKLGEIRGN